MPAGRSIVQWPIDVLFRPEQLVYSQDVMGTHSLRLQLAAGAKLLLFLAINLVLYALPLTIAGHGVEESGTAPAAFVTVTSIFVDNPTDVWEFSIALANNSAFLIVAALLIFATFHIGVILSWTSHGILQSLRVVTYSISIYLALIFSLVWYLSLSPRVEVADEFLISLQTKFFYYFIDLFQVNLELPGGRPATVQISTLTTLGSAILVLIMITTIYFLYVLYIGARVNHDASKTEAFTSIIFVIIAPALYATGVIIFSLIL